jgi:2-dehydropantoate 2-reductase
MPATGLTMPRVEYAIFGAGALGSIIGAHLARAGHEVVLLARGRRAAQISADGLRIEGLVNLTVPVPVATDPRLLKSAEILIVATKAIDTAGALEPIRGAEIGAALSIQNGIRKDELLAAAFGDGAVIGAVANVSGELFGSGAVMFTRNVDLRVGELRGPVTRRVRSVAASLEAAGIRATVSDTILADEWSKFAAWVGLMALAVTTRRNTWEYLCNPDAARVLVRLVREVGRLAGTCDVELAGAPVLPVQELCRVSDERAVEIVTTVGEAFRRNAPTHRVSSLQDLEAGRPLEIEETIGYAVAMARRLKLELPLLENFYGLLSAIGCKSAVAG